MIPVIVLRGGDESLWPFSRTFFPKPFVSFFGEPLVVRAFQCATSLGTPLVLTTENMRGLAESYLREYQSPLNIALYGPLSLCLEALKHSSSLEEKRGESGVALAEVSMIADLCCQLRSSSHEGEGEGEVVGIFPADHWIEGSEILVEISQRAETLIQNEAIQLVSLGLPLIEGVKLGRGRGYIDVGEGDLARGFYEPFEGPLFEGSFSLEKKNRAKGSSRFLQDSGVFFFKVGGMLQHLKEQFPEVLSLVESIHSDRSNAKEIYQQISLLRSLKSFHCEVLGSFQSSRCLMAEIGWSGLSSWEDVFNNRDLKTQSEDIEVDAKNNHSLSLTKKVVGFLGVEDLRLVDTGDAILVCKAKKKGFCEDLQKGSQRTFEEGERINSQGDSSMKSLVGRVREADSQAVDYQTWDMRPWGQYRTLLHSGSELVKKIWVNPGAKFSYQSHDFREEHWIVVLGEGEVILNGETIPVQQGSYVHVPRGVKHRMINTGKGELVFIEVQQGNQLLESDITRYEDDFGRC